MSFLVLALFAVAAILFVVALLVMDSREEHARLARIDAAHGHVPSQAAAGRSPVVVVESEQVPAPLPGDLAPAGSVG